MRLPLSLLLAAAAFLAGPPARAAELDLAGDWGVLLDPQNNGTANGLGTPQYWAIKEVPTVHLPSSIQSQKIGDLPSAKSPWTARIGLAMLNNPKYLPYQTTTDFKTPFWLTPDRVYVGSAWFNREIDIPPAFANQRILLTLERPHWQTTVYVDGKQVGGMQDSLGTPHVHDLTDALPVGKHTLILRVDNRVTVPVGMDASAVTDQTQSNWNGVVGDLKLSTTPKVFIDDVQIFPDVANKRIHVKVALGNTSGLEGQGPLSCTVAPRGKLPRFDGGDLATNQETHFKVAHWDKSGGKLEFDYDMPNDAATWDEFNPNLYEMALQFRPIPPGGPVTQTPMTGLPADLNSRITIFGLRQISTNGPQLLLNNHPIQLRGTLECCIFPLTGYPPAGPQGAAYWKKIYTQLKAFGLNHLRFHSWCPPEVAFQVADEMGIYLQIEGGAWAAFGSSGLPTTEPAPPDAGGRGGAALDQWIVRETDAMLRA